MSLQINPTWHSPTTSIR